MGAANVSALYFVLARVEKTTSQNHVALVVGGSIFFGLFTGPRRISASARF